MIFKLKELATILLITVCHLTSNKLVLGEISIEKIKIIIS